MICEASLRLETQEKQPIPPIDELIEQSNSYIHPALS